MSKNRDNKKTRRINKVKASKESYFQLHWFLMYEDKYRGLTPKAKLLYGMLRSRHEVSNLTVNSGSEHAEKYIDEDNNIFCIFDNVEIAFLLNMTIPTVIAAKKELDDAGLLEEVPVKDEANRIYVLDPVLDSDMWTFNEQLAKIKDEKAEKDKERVRKQREKRKMKAEEKKKEKAQKKAAANQKVKPKPETDPEKSCDSKNLNHTNADTFDVFCDLNNLNHVTKDFLPNITRVFNLLDIKDFSKYVSKGDTQIVIEFYNTFFKPTKYAAINLEQMIQERSASIVLEAILRAIPKDDIQSPIAFIKNTLNNWIGCSTVEEVLAHEEKFRKEQQEKKSKGQTKLKPQQKRTTRKEMVPKWLEDKEHNAPPKEKEYDPDFEKQKRELEESLKKLDQDIKNKNKELTPGEIAQAKIDARQAELKRRAEQEKAVLT